MSGNKLIDDYLSDLMDDDAAPAPTARPADAADASEAAAPAPAEADREPPADAADSVGDPGTDDPAGTSDALAGPGDVTDEPGTDDRPTDSTTAADPAIDSTTVARADAVACAEPDRSGHAEADEAAAAEPEADPLAGFRVGGKNISDDEFEAMLDVLSGKTPAPTASPATDPVPVAFAPAPAADPLAAFRDGGNEIGEDEFEAMLDALSGSPPARPAAPPVALAEPIEPDDAIAVAAPPRRPSAPTAAPLAAASAALADLVASASPPSARAMTLPDPHERRQRRAEERVTSWLRFSIARQSFAVEVLKVQEVLRLPAIMPVRGTERAMLGAMNLRGQIVPVMDLALKLGFPVVERTEASRVIVLEEHGETLGLLVASVADVANVSDARIERISGTPSLVAAEVVRGIARRDGNIIILLDASRLLA